MPCVQVELSLSCLSWSLWTFLTTPLWKLMMTPWLVWKCRTWILVTTSWGRFQLSHFRRWPTLTLWYWTTISSSLWRLELFTKSKEDHHVYKASLIILFIFSRYSVASLTNESSHHREAWSMMVCYSQVSLHQQLWTFNFAERRKCDCLLLSGDSGLVK